MNELDIVRALHATTSRKEKEAILENAFMQGNRKFFDAMTLAYDSLITFGVKKIPEIVDEDDGSEGSFTYENFIDLSNKLRTRKLTGHAARDALLDACDRCNVSMWNEFYRRVLLKDMRCGIDTSTVNSALKKIKHDDASSYIIPVFSCQLAQDGAKEEHAKKLVGMKMLDVKLDGVRLLTILDKENGTVTQYTRNGRINTNFDEIREGLAKLLQELPGSVVLDGEVVSSNFQELMTQMNRKNKVDTSNAKLALFDIIPLEDFKKGKCDSPQELRHIILSNLETTGDLKKFTDGRVYVVPKLTVNLDTSEGQEQFKEFNKQAIDAGYEGIMVKDPNAPYKIGRSFSWLKIKPFIEVTLKIVGVYEGEPGSKYEGMLGGFIMEGEDDGKLIRTECGTGFSDKDREDIWKNQNEWIGIMGEIVADALTLEKNSTTYSARFPRWKGRRGFEVDEKI